ncbi:hypothetical protein FGO68_gene9013 [Halteria grandinella]|uniref:Uncharacterized protein n=1 Tax=Halteria grandinella TaxID=5974 RepID=A0A8J8NSJ8_HALGN|nr:hypothetical protein FGO68_gene9013 [Halteria grandinella]
MIATQAKTTLMQLVPGQGGQLIAPQLIPFPPTPIIPQNQHHFARSQSVQPSPTIASPYIPRNMLIQTPLPPTPQPLNQANAHQNQLSRLLLNVAIPGRVNPIPQTVIRPVQHINKDESQQIQTILNQLKDVAQIASNQNANKNTVVQQKAEVQNDIMLKYMQETLMNLPKSATTNQDNGADQQKQSKLNY